MSDTNSAYSAPIPSRKVRFHQRRGVEERRNWVKRYERSGQTLKQFCEQHGLALSSFCLWKRQLSQTVARQSG
jgi:transposase-like protein